MDISEFDSRSNNTDDDLVLWEVVEEHLDEADFGVDRFEYLLDQPLLSLQDLERNTEARLVAHLDALVIGGSPVAKNLLARQLEQGDVDTRSRVIACVMALIMMNRHDLIASGLFHTDEVVRSATIRACMLVGTQRLEAWAYDRWRRTEEPNQRMALIPIVKSQIEPSILLEYLQSNSTPVVVSAANAVEFSASDRYLPIMDHLLERTEEPEVLNAALVRALAWGSTRGWAVCEHLALNIERVFPIPMALCALLGGPSQHRSLVRLLERDTHRASALFSLGFSGNSELVPVLVEHIDSDNRKEAKLAADAIATITGLDLQEIEIAEPVSPTVEGSASSLEDDHPEQIESLPPLGEDDLDADLVPDYADALPLPNRKAVIRHWEQSRERFSPKQRYLAGQPFDIQSLFDYMQNGWLGRRHVLALGLCIRTGGKICIDTRAFTAKQKIQMEALRGLEKNALSRQFSRF